MAYRTNTTIGFRFLGNVRTKEVHDLNNKTNQCQIEEIINAGNAVRFMPDTLTQACNEGYDNCHWCIGNSRR